MCYYDSFLGYLLKELALKQTDPKNLIVTQANALAMSAQKMTLQEKRLLLLLISQIRMTDSNLKTYRIFVSEVVDYLEIKSNDVYATLQNVCDKLMSRVLTVKEDDGSWEKFQWVSKCKYIVKEKSSYKKSYLEMRIHEDLQPLLLNLKTRFGSIPLRQIAIMRSVNSIRLLEILYFQSHNVNIKEFYFDLKDLKKRLGLEGMYKNFAFFRRDVLERARIECIEKSPITFLYETKKKWQESYRVRV